ncbi:MAG TPA: hypothetical protein VGQ06_05960 [Gemmatimonadales bacterium]|jgi:hypothetical protein|nr:hypothetical protein [Gemmatimonadales bacterium]
MSAIALSLALAAAASRPGASQGVSQAACERALGTVPAAAYLHVSDRPHTREMLIEVGPVDIPARTSAPHQRDLAYQLGYAPVTGWIHGFTVRLVDARGHAVPRLRLHHIVIARPASRELFLPITQRFLGVGQETRDLQFPSWLVGTAVYAGEPLLVNTMLDNPTDTTYRGVRVQLVVSYTRRRPLLEVAPFNVDAMFPLGEKVFDLPPGRSEHAWEGSPAVPVRLLLVGGHLHRYARSIQLSDVTTGEVIWRAHPDTDHTGAVTRMPVQLIRLGLGRTLVPTHRYRLAALYDNPTGQPIRRGGMAKIAGLVVPAGGVQWPTTDRADSLYQEDLRRLLRSGCSTRMDMASH